MTQEKVKYLYMYINFSVGSRLPGRLLHTRCWAHACISKTIELPYDLCRYSVAILLSTLIEKRDKRKIMDQKHLGSSSNSL